ncbi:hypothetical protein Rs2_41078 [Raphanus sativus]|nr:hypothetical protein Rs2_41078 [Raphanus sativus]
MEEYNENNKEGQAREHQGVFTRDGFPSHSHGNILQESIDARPFTSIDIRPIRGEHAHESIDDHHNASIDMKQTDLEEKGNLKIGNLVGDYYYKWSSRVEETSQTLEAYKMHQQPSNHMEKNLIAFFPIENTRRNRSTRIPLHQLIFNPYHPIFTFKIS